MCLKSGHAEGGAEGKCIEGEGEEEAGRDQGLSHRPELNKRPCASNARSLQ